MYSYSHYQDYQNISEAMKQIKEQMSHEEIMNGLLKKYGKDPLYKALITAKTDDERTIAKQNLIDVRGPQAFHNMVADYGKMKGMQKEAYGHNGSEEQINESDYQIYHKTYTSAIDAARQLAKKKGYEFDEDDYFAKVSSGPRKPGVGKTNIMRIALTKDGKPVKKGIQIQVYGMEGGKYELNTYLEEYRPNNGTEFEEAYGYKRDAKNKKPDWAVDDPKAVYTIIGSKDGEVLDTTEVKGVNSAKDILTSWKSSGRYSKVSIKSRELLKKDLRKILNPRKKRK